MRINDQEGTTLGFEFSSETLIANDANSRDRRSCQWVNDEEHSKGCGQNAHENAPGGTLLQILS